MIKKVIVLMGLPGSGKGTQGAIISRELMIPHISTGDILRKMVQQDTPDSKLLAGYMNEGKLVPADLVNKIVRRFILSDECKNGCILDGYPRNLQQAEYFIENIDAEVVAIFFNLDDKSAVSRIMGRISCNQCGKIYNQTDMPKDGVCDECGSTDLLTRPDDDEKTVLTRLEAYKKETLPMIDYYKKKGKFFNLHANMPKDKVTEEILSVVKKI